MKNFTLLLDAILRSNRFFIVVLILLIVQAAWLALAAQYPLAFDENFHYGIIKLYAQQWSPIFTETPPNSGAYGALTRDASYMFHYLLSFPYRLIASITDNEIHQIILLRFINIAFFAVGMVAFRKLLLSLSIGRRLTNFSLLILVFVPVVPFLAAHINYDNLLFALLPITLLVAVRCTKTLQSSGRIPVISFFSLIILLLFTTLVKYVFLPVALGIAFCLFIIYLRQPQKIKLLSDFFESFKKRQWSIQIGLILGIVLFGGLFIERDVMNVFQYGSPSPSCEKVESIEHCSQYGPWNRDYGYAQNIKSGDKPPADPNIAQYGFNWFRGLIHRLFFAINYNYANEKPLPVPYATAVGFVVVGILAVLLKGRAVIKKYPQLSLALIAFAIYTVALFYTNYSAFLRYNVHVAINGRYFIPFLPIMFAVVGLALYELFSSVKQSWLPYLKVTFVLATLFVITQGGGILTFLVHSDASWYWQNEATIRFNEAAQRVIQPFVIGG